MGRRGSVHAIALVCPGDGVLRIKSLREAFAGRVPLCHGIVKGVRVLGFDEVPQWTRDSDALRVTPGSIRGRLPLAGKGTVS